MIKELLKGALMLPFNVVGGIGNGIKNAVSGGAAEQTTNAEGKSFDQELYTATMKQKAAKLMQKYDKNADGVLTLDELPINAKDFAKFDLSEDGKIELKELTALMSYIDSNKDTVISKEERQQMEFLG